MVHGDGRRIDAPSAFAGDDGRADPALRQALESGDAEGTLARLRQGARLLVPVVAVLEEIDEDGADKSSHMASVSLVQADGRRGLLAFTSVDTLKAWDPLARPVPATAPDVAAAALEEGADGVLVDIAGPIRFALDGDALRAVAAARVTNA
ncbi:MAG: hypothetical protein B7C55_01745 [Actinomycetales bacterium mxb001]|nr:MAG: hypothetical protein B7C55_01745 [Actinomycetales bacterium mxb001]